MPQEEKKPSAISGFKFTKKAPAAGAAETGQPPDDYSKKFAQAASLYGSGMLEEASKLFGELSSLGYNASECLRYLALISLRKGDIPNADSLIEKAISTDPANAKALIAQAEIRAEDGDYLSAIDIAKNAIGMMPEEPEFDQKVGGFYLALKSPAKAIQHLNSARAKHKDPSGIPDTLYLMMGEANARLNDEVAAARAYLRAIALNPKNKRAEDEIARMRGVTDDKYKAEDAKANPRATALLDKAMEFFGKEDVEHMQSSVEEALKFAPKYYRAHWVLGTIHSMLNRSENAASEFELAMECYPDHYLPYNNLGIIHANRGEEQKALGLYTESIKRYPFDPTVFKNRAELLFKMRRHDEAIEDFDAAIALKPEDKALSECHMERAEALAAVGKRKEAEDGLAIAMKLDPENKRAEALLAEIRTTLVSGFSDVVGMEQLKETLFEAAVLPLRNKELAKKYGLAVGGGILLYGPPGCGKTHIVRALAKEAKLVFINVKITDVIGADPSETVKNFHNLFENARSKAPALIFIDEVEALGGSREAMAGAAEKREINQLLTEMDGMVKNQGLVIIGATNAPWDVDTALKRPGRFGKLVYVPPPDVEMRGKLFKHYLAGRPSTTGINFAELAALTEGASAADVKAKVEDAASFAWKDAMRSGTERPISMDDLRTAASKKSTVIKEWFTKIQGHMEEPGAQEIYSGVMDDMRKYGGFNLIAKSNLTFADVAGMEQVKQSIRAKIIEPVKNPKLYKKYGVKAGGGILLYGPPGCGKSYIMKAAAGEGGVNFVTAKLSDIISKWVGESEQNIHKIFETARKNAPCILFFDEIDTLGGARGEGQAEYDSKVVNQLLTELDGVTSGTEGVLVVGATNLPWKVDVALRRSGRLSDAVYIPPPDKESRQQLFKISCKGKPVAKDVDFAVLAEKSDGFASADVSDVCDRAIARALDDAMKTGQEREVTMKDFLDAIGKKTPTIAAWYNLASKELEGAPDKEMFGELLNDIKQVGKVGLMKKSSVTFADVAGMDGLKKQIKAKILGPLRNPELAKRYGIKAGGGILLYGPPGCGKSYIMKAAAGEGGVNFVTAKLSDVISKWVGESEQNIHNIFETARKNAPCILFFDEIDTLGGMREAGQAEHDAKVVNQLLMEMDGVGSSSEGVLMVGATNMPWKVDLALRRSGRLSDSIYVPPPDTESRKALFILHTKGKPLAPDVSIDKLAEMTDGYASADVKEICDKVFYDVYQAAMDSGEEKPASMDMFMRAVKGKRPTMVAWYNLATRELEGTPDKEIFDELYADADRLKGLRTKKD